MKREPIFCEVDGVKYRLVRGREMGPCNKCAAWEKSDHKALCRKLASCGRRTDYWVKAKEALDECL